MKVKSKLATDWHLDPNSPLFSISDAYVAGFEKAREMAIDALKNKHSDQACFQEYDLIANLGEEEVKDEPRT